MNQFLEWLSRLFGSWKFWVVIPPWDIGVRIRLGKIAHGLPAGLHFRVPFIDDITLVNTRLRIVTTNPMTLPGTSQNKTKVITAVIGYYIEDPVGALLAFSDPGSAIVALAQAKLTKSLSTETTLPELQQEFKASGIKIDYIYLTENVEVRTIRLINGQGGVFSGPSYAKAPGTDSIY